MISIYGHRQDLPEYLCICPRCEQANLEWDGRRSWRCMRSSCAHRIALSAVFADDSIDSAFMADRVNLKTVRLTAFGSALQRVGVSILPCGDVATAEDLEREYRNQKDIERLMYNIPRRGTGTRRAPKRRGAQ